MAVIGRLQHGKNLYYTILTNLTTPPAPSHTGLYQDAQASWDFLLSRHDIDQSKLIIFGRSLGGAVAIHLAASLGHNDQ